MTVFNKILSKSFKFTIELRHETFFLYYEIQKKTSRRKLMLHPRNLNFYAPEKVFRAKKITIDLILENLTKRA